MTCKRAERGASVAVCARPDIDMPRGDQLVTQKGSGGQSYRDRDPRVSVRCNAMLIEHDGCTVDVVIIDVSSTGFRLESLNELVAGEDVLLQSPKQHPVRARIQWTRGFEAGGIFLESVAL